jgi:hypothetical protein
LIVVLLVQRNYGWTPRCSSLNHIIFCIRPRWVHVNLMMAIKAHRQEKLYLVEPIPKPSSPMVNLARHLALAYLADWCVAQKLLSHIRIDLVLLSSLGRHLA